MKVLPSQLLAEEERFGHEIIGLLYELRSGKFWDNDLYSGSELEQLDKLTRKYMSDGFDHRVASEMAMKDLNLGQPIQPDEQN